MATFKFISSIFPIEIKVLPNPSEFHLTTLDPRERRNELIWVELLSLSTGRLSGYYELIKNGGLSGFTVAVEASYSPPPFYFPLKEGFDVAIYSKPSIIVGPNAPNSGYIAVNSPEEAGKLNFNRTVMGPILGNMDAWNLIRCLKTYALRSKSQSETTCEIFKWLKSDSWALISGILPSGVAKTELHLPPILAIQFYSNSHANKVATAFNCISSRVVNLGNASKMEFSPFNSTEVGECCLIIGLESFDILKSNLALVLNDLEFRPNPKLATRL